MDQKITVLFPPGASVSVLNTTGGRLNVSSSTSWQNEPSRTFDGRQAATYRPNPSRVVAGYMNPLDSAPPTLGAHSPIIANSFRAQASAKAGSLMC